MTSDTHELRRILEHHLTLSGWTREPGVDAWSQPDFFCVRVSLAHAAKTQLKHEGFIADWPSGSPDAA